MQTYVLQTYVHIDNNIVLDMVLVVFFFCFFFVFFCLFFYPEALILFYARHMLWVLI